MKTFPKRFGTGHANDRFANLSLIRIGCNEVLASKRIDQAMSLIEHEWLFSTAKNARRLWIDLGAHVIRTNR
jgi:hypothetical protein